MLDKITVKDKQTIFDVALQYYGAVEGIGLLLEDNPTLELDVPLQFGQRLLIRKQSVLDNNIVKNLNTPTHG